MKKSDVVLYSMLVGFGLAWGINMFQALTSMFETLGTVIRLAVFKT